MKLRMAVFDDRLEVENPGTLPFGLTVADLKAGVSRIRNPVIARVLRELELMEMWGYRRMRVECGPSGYPLPEWVELGSVIRCVFPPHQDVAAAVGAGTGHVPANVPASAGFNERQGWFLEQLSAGAAEVPIGCVQDPHPSTDRPNARHRQQLPATGPTLWFSSGSQRPRGACQTCQTPPSDSRIEGRFKTFTA